jgi:predicted HTH domain antitoxin
MSFQVQMEFNDELLPALRKTPEEFAREIRFLAAAKWYETGLLSQEKAAEAAGLSRVDFMMEISRLGISPFQYSAQDVIEDVDHAC